jgi:hypothetical protein
MSNILAYVPPGVQYPLKFPVAIAAYDAASVGVYSSTTGTPIADFYSVVLRRMIVRGGAAGTTNIRFWNTTGGIVVIPIAIDPAAFPYLPWVIDFGPRGLHFPGGIGANGLAGTSIVDFVFDYISRRR